MTKIGIDRLKERIHYDPNNGAFINLRNSEPAGYIDPSGYTIIMVDGKSYRGTHIAFAIQEGEWPVLTMDHKDRDPTNNRWANLRQATQKQQNQNKNISVRNKSGVVGVYQTRTGKWAAKITIDDRNIHLGTYSDLSDAKRARMQAELEHYEFSPLLS